MEWLTKLLAAIKKLAGEDADLTEIESAIKEGVKGEVETATGPLAQHKETILAEKKKLQDKLKLFDGIDPEKYNALKQQLEALELKEVFEAGDLESVKSALATKHSTELAAKDTEIESLLSDLHDVLVDQGLTNALLENKVKKEYMSAVKALLKDGVQITKQNVDGKQKHTATVGDVALADYVKKWAASDDAKIYIAASKDGGGGSGGSDGGSGSSATDVKTRYNELLGKEKLTSAENVELNKLAEMVKAEQQNPDQQTA